MFSAQRRQRIEAAGPTALLEIAAPGFLIFFLMVRFFRSKYHSKALNEARPLRSTNHQQLHQQLSSTTFSRIF